MKMKSMIAVAVLAISTLSTVAQATTTWRCGYEYKGEYQHFTIDERGNRYGDGKLKPFMLHHGSSEKLDFGTSEIEFLTADERDKRIRSWIYVEAYSDVAQMTFQMDLKKGKITIIKKGKTVLDQGPLSCDLSLGGE
ncbi:hypothetical protein ACNH6C_09720 [Bdellovibrio bacteriovorus]|uniref:hypothetical protein n=1 Tax=Bdellovibrio bacteriovorus TaxID=959 RepID=UPI003A7FB747